MDNPLKWRFAIRTHSFWKSSAIAGLVAVSTVGAEEPPTPTPASTPTLTLTKAPQLQTFVQASYPEEAARAGIEGEVVLLIDVDAAGKVVRVEIEKPAGHGFDEAARSAANQFVFSPAEAAGKPVDVRITYRYRFTLAQAQAARQAVNLRGVVKERGTRAVLPGIPLSIDGTHQTETDAFGHFEFSVSAGEIAVRISAPEYYPFETHETVLAGKRVEVVYYLERRRYDPYETVVRARRPRKDVTQQTLEIQEVARIPGTQGDTLKVVQNLPGVARPAFAGGDIIVWGSSAEDTGIFLETVRIPRLYHFGGVRSVVASSVVQSVDFVPGAYGVRYGRGLGGVVDVSARAPRTDRVHGEVGADIIDTGVLVEGPIWSSTSALVAVRRSYIDAILANVATGELQFGTAPRYYDYQALVRHTMGARSSLTFFVFGSDDETVALADNPDPALRAQIGLRDYFHKALAVWRRSVNETRLLGTASVGYQSTGVDAGFGRTAKIKFDQKTIPFSGRFELSRPLWGPAEIRAGLDVEGQHGTAQVIAPGGPPREDAEGGQPVPKAPVSDAGTFNQVHMAPFVELPMTLLSGRLRLAPGLRVDLYAGSAYRGTPDEVTRVEPNLEPRFGGRYQLTKKLAFRGAAGLYHQPAQLAELSRSFGDPDLRSPSDIQTTAGVDIEVRPRITLETDVFYKNFRDLVVASDEQTGPLVENDGIGRAYGVQTILRHESDGKFFGWLAYTLMRAERRDHAGEGFRSFDFDQTHILTLVASRRLAHNWELGLRFRLTSGSTFTPVIGSYFDSQTGQYQPIFSKAENSDRLPAFHQLDLRVEKMWIYKMWMLTAYLELMNAYNRANPEQIVYNFDLSESQYVTGLPILPVIGARGQF